MTLKKMLFVVGMVALTVNTAQAGSENTAVLTAQEVAELLRVDATDVLKMAQTQAIPARQFGQQWRFNRTAVLAWLAGKDPVGAVILAENSTEKSNHLSINLLDKQIKTDEAPLMAQAELQETMGRGVVGENSEKKNAPPPTIGEKSKTKTAEEVFLRDQAVLLKPRQMTFELGLLYARNDRHDLLPFQNTEFDTSVVQSQLTSETFTSSYSVRYGLFDNIQVFSNIPLSDQTQNLTVGSQDLSQQSSTRWGAVTSGLRYAAWGEGSGYPGAIFSIDGNFPTDNRPYGMGASVALTKSYDPAVLFFSFGYRHFFNGQDYLVNRQSADEQFNGSAGIAYALNDTLTLSTSLSGVFLPKTQLQEGFILPAIQQYSLQLGLTSYLAKGLYVEPFVNFGLNGINSDMTLGINLPYSFDL